MPTRREARTSVLPEAKPWLRRIDFASTEWKKGALTGGNLPWGEMRSPGRTPRTAKQFIASLSVRRGQI